MVKRLSNAERFSLVLLLAVAVAFTGMHYLLTNKYSDAATGTAFYQYDYKVHSASAVVKAHQMITEKGVAVAILDAHGESMGLDQVKARDRFVSTVQVDSNGVANKVIFTKEQLD